MDQSKNFVNMWGCIHKNYQFLTKQKVKQLLDKLKVYLVLALAFAQKHKTTWITIITNFANLSFQEEVLVIAWVYLWKFE